MNSSLENKIIKEFKMLNRVERELLLTKLFNLSNNENEESSSEISCPHCSSIYFWKNGKLKNRQRYLCKKCGKSFNIFTNTPISYTKKDMNLWLDYCEELVNQTSLRECAKKLDISLSTAFFWRHKLLDAIRENKPKSILKDEVQVTQVYFRESFKGNHSKSTFNLPRKAYKHKFSWHQESLGIPKNICVLAAKDSREISMATTCCVGRPSAENLVKVYRNHIKRHTTIITDSFDAYKKMALTLSLNQKELHFGYAEDGYNLDNVYNLSFNLKFFIKSYRGVATKYLQNYIDLFIFLQREFIDCPLYLKGKIPYRNTNFKGRPPIYA